MSTKAPPNGGPLTSTNTPKSRNSAQVVASGFKLRHTYFILTEALMAFWSFLDAGNDGVTRVLRVRVSEIDKFRGFVYRVPSIGRLSLTPRA